MQSAYKLQRQSAVEGFGVELLRRLMSRSAGQNVLISPPCISVLLEMLLAGSVAETKKEIAEALGGMDEAELKSSAKYWRKTMQISGEGVEVAAASSWWIRQGFEVNPEYLAEIVKRFGAEFNEVEFNEDSVRRMNESVRRATRDKIKSAVDENAISELTVLIGIAAAYFKGLWRVPFSPEATGEGQLTCSNGDVLPLQMMSGSADRAYMESKSVQVVELPFSGGELGSLCDAPRFEARRFSMYVVLPRVKKLQDFCRDLNDIEIHEWFEECRPTQVWLELPRFKLDYCEELRDALSEMGIVRLFGNAELNGISKSQIYVTRLMQKATLEVDERGAEAAAVAVCFVGFFCADETPKEVNMRVDRPFLCIIRDNTAGRILFIGAVEVPRA